MTVGLWSAGRCANQHVVAYVVAQILGATLGAAILYLIASGKAGWQPGAFAANGYGPLSPRHYVLPAGLLAEVLTTFFFLMIIIGTSSKGRPPRARRRGSPASPSASRSS